MKLLTSALLATTLLVAPAFATDDAVGKGFGGYSLFGNSLGGMFTGGTGWQTGQSSGYNGVDIGFGSDGDASFFGYAGGHQTIMSEVGSEGGDPIGIQQFGRTDAEVGFYRFGDWGM